LSEIPVLNYLKRQMRSSFQSTQKISFLQSERLRDALRRVDPRRAAFLNLADRCHSLTKVAAAALCNWSVGPRN